MFRRRSRGHYDPQQYNTGIPTRSAQASAAANAYYQRQLGPSAAAEASRRHSLDTTGSAAMRDFELADEGAANYAQPQPTAPSFGRGAGARSSRAQQRANSSSRSNSSSRGLTATPGRANSLTSTGFAAGPSSSHASSPSAPHASAPPRRANSSTSRSYQVVYHHGPNGASSPHSPSGAASRPAASPRASWTPANPRRVSSYGSSGSGALGAGSPPVSRSIQPVNRRHSSTSADRSNSSTRTHTVVNRDAQGRTSSSTTTTVRQMGSFELVSTKDIPVASPASSAASSTRLARPQAAFAGDFDGTPSIHSLDSELGGIQEEPEETIEASHDRLARLGDPIEEADESSDFDVPPKPRAAPPASPKYVTRFTKPATQTSMQTSTQTSTQTSPQTSSIQSSPQTADLQNDLQPNPQITDTDLQTNSIQTDSSSADKAATNGPLDSANGSDSAHGMDGAGVDGATGLSTSKETPAPSDDELDLGRYSSDTVSDMTPSPRSEQAVEVERPTESAETEPAETLALPKPDGPAHRETSPARSASRTAATGSAQKTRVSFGGADEPYVYESYEYEDEPAAASAPGGNVAPSPHLAAAAAAARNRAGAAPTQPSAPSAYLQNYQQNHQQQMQQQQRRQFVIAQPAHVQKRPSTSSSTGRSAGANGSSLTAAARAASKAQPAADAGSSSENFADAASSFSEIPVPARSAARPASSPVLDSSAQFASRDTTKAANGDVNGDVIGEDDAEMDEEERTHAQIHAQALALAQAQFSSQNGDTPAPANGSAGFGAGSTGGGHLYRGLVDDDAASVHSDSSFTRETRRGRSRIAGSGGGGRMRSLRQPATPTSRGPNAKTSRKSSLSNQAPPQLDVPGVGAGAASVRANGAPDGAASSGSGGGFRTFSSRNTPRPDAASSLGGNGAATDAKPAKGRRLGGSTGGNLHARHGSAGSERSGGPTNFTSRIADSDSDDDGAPGAASGAAGFFQKAVKKQSHTSNSSSSNGNGKMSFGDVFSPNTEVRDSFKSRAPSDGSAAAAEPKPKPKKAGFFKRVFRKKDKEEVSS